MGRRLREYQTLFDIGRSAAAPEEGAPPIESMVVVLTGRRRPWPEDGKHRTGWPERRKWSGFHYRIDAVYQRTVAKLRARGSVLWLVFVPLARAGRSPSRSRKPSPPASSRTGPTPAPWKTRHSRWTERRSPPGCSAPGRADAGHGRRPRRHPAGQLRPEQARMGQLQGSSHSSDAHVSNVWSEGMPEEYLL
jgi:hypothetical protein